VLTPSNLFNLVAHELQTDRVHEDVTANLLGDRYDDPVKAIVRAREEGVFSGTEVCEALQQVVGSSVQVHCHIGEGESFRKGEILVTLHGPFGACLGLERTLLNFLCHLCGVATQTKRFVEAVKPHPVKILATRKTLPGLRDLQLRAVQSGGGFIHRRSLSDGILIKDNHQAVVPDVQLLETAFQTKSPLHGVEIEVQDTATLDRIIAAKPTVIMLDNLPLPEMEKAVKKIREAGHSLIEVSGGVSLSTVRAIAELGVDFVSVGALTHSVTAVNLSLDIETLEETT
jgi:nicotinate-nucleotide pyrophosphorylase (carboxylating)